MAGAFAFLAPPFAAFAALRAIFFVDRLGVVLVGMRPTLANTSSSVNMIWWVGGGGVVCAALGSSSSYEREGRCPRRG